MQTTRFIVVSSRGWWSFGKVKMYTYSLHIYTIINDALHTVPKWWPEDSSSMATYVCLPWRSIHAPAHPHTSSSFQITRSAICSSRLIVLASFQSLLGWDTLHSGHITSSHSLSHLYFVNLSSKPSWTSCSINSSHHTLFDHIGLP